MGLLLVFTARLRGAGKTLGAATFVVVVYAIIRLPAAQFGAVSIGPAGVWLSIAMTNLIGAVLAYAWHRHGTWKRTTNTDSIHQNDSFTADN